MPSSVIGAAVACAFLLGGCGPRDGVYNTSTFQIHGTIVPPDVAVPSNIGNASTEFNGLYIEGADSFSCCWIAPQATLLVRKRAPATELIAGFRLPSVPRFARGQNVSIALPGASKPARRVRVEDGEQTTVAIPLPARLRRIVGLVPIEIAAATEYVPSRDNPPSRSVLVFLHLRPPVANDDTRRLGVVLLYLYFK